MAKMKNDLADFSEEKEESVSPKMKLRLDMVACENLGVVYFMDFIRKNESKLRVMFDDREKKELRRGIDFSLGRKLSVDDSMFVSSIFGFPVKVTPPRKAERKDVPVRVMTPEEGIKYMRNCTFECFCEWLDLSEDFVKGLNDTQFRMLEDCIRDVCIGDHGLPRQRHFMEGDDVTMLGKVRAWHATA